MISPLTWLPAHLLPVLTALALLNAVLPAAIEHIRQLGFMQALLHGFGQSFIIWLSIAVSFWLWNQSKAVARLPRPQTLVLATVLSLSLLIPLATSAWIGAALVALLWRLSGEHDHFSRATIILVLALSIREPTSRLLLTLCSSEILGFDASVAALFLEVSGRQFEVVGNLIIQENGYSLLILTGCSAFGNLSLSLLLWATATLLVHHRLQRSDAIRVAAVIVLVIGLNALRLALMALGPAWYDLLHEGVGASIHEMSALTVTLVWVRWKTRYEDGINHTGDPVSCAGRRTGSSVV